MNDQQRQDIVSERDADRGFMDLIGIVNPRRPMDDPGTALDCLTEIREISDFIRRVTTHLGCGGIDLTDEDIRILGQLAECVCVASGYLTEWIERDVRPEFQATYDERVAKRRVFGSKSKA